MAIPLKSISKSPSIPAMESGTPIKKLSRSAPISHISEILPSADHQSVPE